MRLDYTTACILLFTAVFTKSDATCRQDQIESCRKAVKSKSLGTFHAGGKCLAKHYVQYTHVCTVTNYLPSTDFCCCVHQLKVLCCRYHQTWGNFRCTQADDTIETISKPGWFGKGGGVKKMPLEVLIPLIVGPILVILCCVVCVVKCCCYRYDADDNQYCNLPCFKRFKRKEIKKTPPYTAAQRPSNKVEECEPFTTRHPSGVASQYSTGSTSSDTRLIPKRNSSDVTCLSQPTAPPIERLDEREESAFTAATTGTEDQNQNCSCNSHQNNVRLNFDSDYSGSASFSMHGNQSSGEVKHCNSCSLPQCPPPAYELHAKDRVLT